MKSADLTAKGKIEIIHIAKNKDAVLLKKISLKISLQSYFFPQLFIAGELNRKLEKFFLKVLETGRKNNEIIGCAEIISAAGEQGKDFVGKDNKLSNSN